MSNDLFYGSRPHDITMQQSLGLRLEKVIDVALLTRNSQWATCSHTDSCRSGFLSLLRSSQFDSRGRKAA